MDVEKNKPSFNKLAPILTVTLLVVIVILSLYLFNIISFPSFLVGQNANTSLPKTDTSMPESKTEVSSTESLIETLPFVNDSDKWMSKEIINGKIKVLSSLKINSNMLVTFQNDAPPESSTGLIFDNGLNEDDANLRKLSLFYFLQNKRWVMRYQEGKNAQYYPMLGMPEDKIFGIFTIAISSDGKHITVGLQNKTTKTIDLPKSLYDSTNRMRLMAQIGPKSTIKFASLTYDISPQ